MGGYGGYTRTNNYIKQIILELDNLIESIKKVDENIYGEKLFYEWGSLNKQKVIDFINNRLDSNEKLLSQLDKINCIVTAEAELIEAIEKLVQFCNKIKEILIKSKDLIDFAKEIELSYFKSELIGILENAISVNSLIDEESKEIFNKKLINNKIINFESTEISFNRKASIWLGTSVFFVFVLLLIVFCRATTVSGLIEINNELGCHFLSGESTTLYIAYGKYIFSYILTYSIILFAIKISIKNYNANKHNEIVNRNKKLTLSVAIDLSREGKNPELLDIAAKELFTSQSTGYNNISEEKSTSNFVNNIIDSVSKKV